MFSWFSWNLTGVVNQSLHSFIMTEEKHAISVQICCSSTFWLSPVLPPLFVPLLWFAEMPTYTSRLIDGISGVWVSAKETIPLQAQLLLIVLKDGNFDRIKAKLLLWITERKNHLISWFPLLSFSPQILRKSSVGRLSRESWQSSKRRRLRERTTGKDWTKS